MEKEEPGRVFHRLFVAAIEFCFVNLPVESICCVLQPEGQVDLAGKSKSELD